MQQDNIASSKRDHARINWHAHLVPLLREVTAEFDKTPKAQRYKPVRLSVLSDAVDNRQQDDGALAHGDSATLQFGKRADTLHAAAPHGHGRPLVTEGYAALVFSQAPDTGAVSVHLYPPVAGHKPVKPYLIDQHANPAHLTRGRLKKLLRGLFEIDLCWTTHADTASLCGKHLMQLEARAATLRRGGAGMLAHLRHMTHLVSGRSVLQRASRALLSDLAHLQLIRRHHSAAQKLARQPRFGRSGHLSGAVAD